MQVRELNLILIKLVRITNQRHEHEHGGRMARRAIRGHCAWTEPHATRAAAATLRASCALGEEGQASIACGAATKQGASLATSSTHTMHNTHAGAA